MNLREEYFRLISKNTRQSPAVEASSLQVIDGKHELRGVDIEVDNLMDDLSKLFDKYAREIIGEDVYSYIDHWGDYHNVPTEAQSIENRLREKQHKKREELLK